MAEDRAELFERFVGLLLEAPNDRTWPALFVGDTGRRARATYFLLHRREPIDPQEFSTVVLQRVLRELSCESERQMNEYRGRVRGKVAWAATLKSRHTGGYDPTRFVCREARRRFDTPENQLLRFMVERVWSCLGQVPRVMRAGSCYYPSSRRHDPETISHRLETIESELSRLRRNIRLRDVTLPDRIGAEHLRRAETSKTESYGLVAELYLRYRACVDSSSWHELFRVGGAVLPLPARADGDGERWLRLAAAVMRGTPNPSPA